MGPREVEKGMPVRGHGGALVGKVLFGLDKSFVVGGDPSGADDALVPYSSIEEVRDGEVRLRIELEVESSLEDAEREPLSPYSDPEDGRTA